MQPVKIHKKAPRGALFGRPTICLSDGDRLNLAVTQHQLKHVRARAEIRAGVLDDRDTGPDVQTGFHLYRDVAAGPRH